MRIFLTGATGYIGGPVLDALVRAGHDVTALVRDNEKAARVSARGGRPVIGNLAQPASFLSSAEAQDGYVHAAFDFASNRGPAIEKAALDAIIAAARRPRPAAAGAPLKDVKDGKDVKHIKRVVIYTSGVWVLGRAPDPIAEDAQINPIAMSSFRPAHEQLVLDAARDDLRTVVVRPGVVYGGGRGLVGDIFKSATNGLVRVVGDGNNRWPLVYDRDLADLYARLAANPEASGIYHANDEGDERVNDIVSAISPYLPVRPDVRHVPMDEARSKMGPFAEALALDQVVRSPRARALGWTPTLHSVAGNAARLLGEWRAARD
jgi:nucleoside-diphosphate-sugar epimerase